MSASQSPTLSGGQLRRVHRFVFTNAVGDTRHSLFGAFISHLRPCASARQPSGAGGHRRNALHTPDIDTRASGGGAPCGQAHHVARRARCIATDRSGTCAQPRRFSRDASSPRRAPPDGRLVFSPLIWPASDRAWCKKKAAPTESSRFDDAPLSATLCTHRVSCHPDIPRTPRSHASRRHS